MGCCVSTAADDRLQLPDSKSPPPSVDADTVVKEVLSETPIIFPDVVDKMAPPFPSPDPIQIHHQISQVLSEICSFTAAKPDDDVISGATPSPCKLRHPRSFSHELGAKPERVVGKSPTRRVSEQSPGHKNGSARELREMGRSGLVSSGNRSGRRSRSPGHRSEAGSSRSHNVGPEKRINQSPGRVRQESTGAKESLENPLVSMECFIFL